jgi:hypothetical protein
MLFCLRMMPDMRQSFQNMPNKDIPNKDIPNKDIPNKDIGNYHKTTINFYGSDIAPLRNNSSKSLAGTGLLNK